MTGGVVPFPAINILIFPGKHRKSKGTNEILLDGVTSSRVTRLKRLVPLLPKRSSSSSRVTSIIDLITQISDTILHWGSTMNSTLSDKMCHETAEAVFPVRCRNKLTCWKEGPAMSLSPPDRLCWRTSFLACCREPHPWPYPALPFAWSKFPWTKMNGSTRGTQRDIYGEQQQGGAKVVGNSSNIIAGVTERGGLTH